MVTVLEETKLKFLNVTIKVGTNVQKHFYDMIECSENRTFFESFEPIQSLIAAMFKRVVESILRSKMVDECPQITHSFEDGSMEISITCKDVAGLRKVISQITKIIKTKFDAIGVRNDIVKEFSTLFPNDAKQLKSEMQLSEIEIEFEKHIEDFMHTVRVYIYLPPRGKTATEMSCVNEIVELQEQLETSKARNPKPIVINAPPTDIKRVELRVPDGAANGAYLAMYEFTNAGYNSIYFLGKQKIVVYIPAGFKNDKVLKQISQETIKSLKPILKNYPIETDAQKSKLLKFIFNLVSLSQIPVETSIKLLKHPDEIEKFIKESITVLEQIVDTYAIFR